MRGIMKCGHLCYVNVYSLRLLPTFRRNLLPPSLGHPNYGDSRFLRKSGEHVRDYMMSYARKITFQISIGVKQISLAISAAILLGSANSNIFSPKTQAMSY